MMSGKDFRLSSDIVPTMYDMFFDVDMDTFHFRGKEIIDIKISKPSLISMQSRFPRFYGEMD